MFIEKKVALLDAKKKSNTLSETNIFRLFSITQYLLNLT